MRKPTDPTLTFHQLVDQFVNGTMGQTIGTMGRQSPALIEHYVHHITGLPWRYPGNAVDLKPDGVLWEVDPPLQYGDVVAFGPGASGSPYGTVGVYLQDKVDEEGHRYIRVLTQGPMPTQPLDISATHMIGVYRIAAAHVQGSAPGAQWAGPGSHVSMAAPDRKGGMTLVQLQAFLDRCHAAQIDPDRPVKIRIGWRQQLQRITTDDTP